MRQSVILAFLTAGSVLASFGATLCGRVADPQSKAVAGATLTLRSADRTMARARSDASGAFRFPDIAAGSYYVRAEAAGFNPVTQGAMVADDHESVIEIQFKELAAQTSSLVISAKSLEPTIDLRNAEVFDRTLFSRDDQIFQQVDAGINAGQHEGGGKSLEIRRFGFNLDHGGVNGGLKVLVDDVQQSWPPMLAAARRSRENGTVPFALSVQTRRETTRSR